MNENIWLSPAYTALCEKLDQAFEEVGSYYFSESILSDLLLDARANLITLLQNAVEVGDTWHMRDDIARLVGRLRIMLDFIRSEAEERCPDVEPLAKHLGGKLQELAKLGRGARIGLPISKAVPDTGTFSEPSRARRGRS